MKDIIRELILESVGTGAKGVELSCRVAIDLHDKKIDFEPDMIIQCLNELVKDDELIEVEYSTPEMPNRVKSFYLPKGSVIYKCDPLYK